MNKLIRVGKFVRLLDGQNNLSISNIIVVLMMYKVMSTEAINMTDMAATITALVPYSIKKFKGKDL